MGDQGLTRQPCCSTKQYCSFADLHEKKVKLQVVGNALLLSSTNMAVLTSTANLQRLN